MNFDPLIFFKIFIFFISCLNIIIKGYKSQSPAKFTSIYYLCQVPPLGSMSKNDEKSVIFGDFGKIHDFPGLDIPAELVKTAGDWVLRTSYLLLSPKFLRIFLKIFKGVKIALIFWKIRILSQISPSEASFTKEIQWWQIEFFKIVNFEFHDRVSVQKKKH